MCALFFLIELYSQLMFITLQKKVKQHLFIIYGTQGSNTLGQIRSLGGLGIKPIVVFLHKSTFRVDKSKYIEKSYSFSDINEGLNFIIKQFGQKSPKPFLYTDCDEIMGIFDKRYNELIDKFYFWNAGVSGRLTYYMDKNNQVNLAKECGMLVPKTEVVKVGELPKGLSYPIFTKSINSLSQWWKGNSYICNNEEELIQAYKRMDVENILLQEYIVKQDETPIEGISINSGEEILLTVKSINYRLTKESHGIFRHIEPFRDTELGEKIIRFIKETHYSGIFGIEFIIDKQGKAYFLETNFRITQYNSAYAMFGANLPYIYAQSVLQNKMATHLIKYTDKRPFNVMSEFEDFKFSCLRGNVSLIQWIKDVRQTDCFQFYDKYDKKPFYFTLWSKFIDLLKHFLQRE